MLFELRPKLMKIWLNYQPAGALVKLAPSKLIIHKDAKIKEFHQTGAHDRNELRILHNQLYQCS